MVGVCVPAEAMVGVCVPAEAVRRSPGRHSTAHRKRGTPAMGDAGVIPDFQGVLCHDNWKPYATLDARSRFN